MGLFSGQTILVTGASGGVGEAVVRRLGEQGANVCLTGRNRERLEEIAAHLPGKNGQCYPADLTVAAELEEAVQRILETNQRLDVLIHCAAVILMDPVASGLLRGCDSNREFSSGVSGT